jgi:enediyne polyketide synthase
MACVYPDADSPTELWRNVLAQRRSFRRLQECRFPLEDYWSPDPAMPDRTYSDMAAVITGWSFDRAKFRVSGSVFRSVDLTHWLALDVATRALADAGFEGAKDLPRETTGVFVGNTLAGEFSRAAVMRLRWPYVRRVLAAADPGFSNLADMERIYKSSFPEVNGETLAGGMSNTIAGRICNFYDLRGGGYTVDGACASSLLAMTHACQAITSGDLDAALVVGVDLSLDPFELIGFAKAGALAKDDMLVYDEASAGFWPGEGCGALLLVGEALAMRSPCYAEVRGWGVSSDGSGGLTRPEVDGQLLAVRRAYRRAGFGPDTVDMFEGHGTGTKVGDATEIKVLSQAREEAGASGPAALGSVKANIGHTKAAAGIASLIKATMAARCGILPPATGSNNPNRLISAGNMLRLLDRAEPWPARDVRRAAVSAMGFGGINVHTVIEAPADKETVFLPAWSGRRQDAEIFLFAAESNEALGDAIRQFDARARTFSYGELVDAAAALAGARPEGRCRAAVIAGSPKELREKVDQLRAALHSGKSSVGFEGISLGTVKQPPRLGLLFPGQGAPVYTGSKVWSRRFPEVANLWSGKWIGSPDASSTEVAQPAITASALAGIEVLERVGLVADVAVGHSVGELAAYVWAGALSPGDAMLFASGRGRAMQDCSPPGRMAAIWCAEDVLRSLLAKSPVEIACRNGPAQFVVAGTAEDVREFVRLAESGGHAAKLLAVSRGFHSSLMKTCRSTVAGLLEAMPFGAIRRQVVSTVTGGVLDGSADLRAILLDQVMAPVRFREALQAAGPVDLWIEAGPASGLAALVGAQSETPVVSLDSGGRSLRPLLNALGTAWTMGAQIEMEALFADRYVRPFSMDAPVFFESPCEAPLGREVEPMRGEPVEAAGDASSISTVVTELIARRVELSVQDLRPEMRMLSDLHLNSIVVGQIVADAARKLGMPPLTAVTEYANASLAEIVDALTGLGSMGARPVAAEIPAGAGPWVRFFAEHLDRCDLEPVSPAAGSSEWKVIAPPSEFGDKIRRRFETVAGRGYVLCVPASPGIEDIPMLLAAAKQAVEQRETFIVVQHRGGGAALAKSVFVETRCPVCVVDVPKDCAEAVEWVAAEAGSIAGYVEAHYDSAGERYRPVTDVIGKSDREPDCLLGPEDTFLVTGGGKGIAAECALALAKASGARIAILGRSDPESDLELQANLRRMLMHGVRVEYLRADVRDREAVHLAIREIRATAIIYGAGINRPRLIPDLSESDFRETVSSKTDGLRNVLSAIDPHRLRLLVTFGSAVARIGLAGEADYAVANEWLRLATEEWQAAHPNCRSRAIEWSLWSGTGMGQRIGRTDLLARSGIEAFSIDQGVSVFMDAVGRSDLPVAVLASSRFGSSPTLTTRRVEMPLLRFLESPRIHVPGVELVADCELSAELDPYLADHVFDGAPLVPGVMLLEAAAQAVCALRQSEAPPAFADVRFLRPLVMPDDLKLTIRIAALLHEDGSCEVAVRSASTGFQADHFRCVCPASTKFREASIELPPAESDVDGIALYPNLLFHGSRFQRVGKFRVLEANRCVAAVRVRPQERWFHSCLPNRTILGDPGARDAALHAVQASIPQGAVLPVAVGSVHTSGLFSEGEAWVHAVETGRDGELLFYELDVTDSSGRVLESWRGLQLKIVRELKPCAPWHPGLLKPLIGRALLEHVPYAGVQLRFEANENGIMHRPDGKPEAIGLGAPISRSHFAGHCLTVTGKTQVACDVERIQHKSEADWRGLLGSEGWSLATFLARQTGLDLDGAATRVWSLRETLFKAGAGRSAAVVMEGVHKGGWVEFAAGPWRILTWSGAVAGMSDPIAVAIAVDAVHPGMAHAAVSEALG